MMRFPFLNRFLGALLIGQLALLGLSLGWTLSSLKSVDQGLMLEIAETRSSLIGEAMRNGLFYHDRALIDEVVDDLHGGAAEVRGLMLYERRGQVFRQVGRLSRRCVPQEPMLQPIGEAAVLSSGPIHLEGMEVGWLCLELGFGELREARGELAGSNLLIAGAILALTFVLTIGLTRLLGRRLEALEQGAQELSQGNLEFRIEVSRKDEFSKLGQSFNQLAANLAQERQSVAQQQAQLEESEQTYRELVEVAKVGVLRLDPQGRILFANRQMSSLLHVEPGSLAGQSLFKYLGDEGTRLLEEKLQGSETDRSEVVDLFLARADSPHLSLSVSPIFTEGKLSAALVYVTDISHRIALEQEMQRAQQLAEQASEAKSRFLANMSHELRTPMNGVLGLTELLLSSPQDEENRENLNMIYHSGLVMVRILNDILDLTKIEKGHLKLQESPFDPCRLLEMIGELFSGAARAQQLKLKVNCTLPAPLRLMGDHHLLEQVLSNLVGNALKFTEEGEVILALEVKEHRGHAWKLRFSVSDTGQGIAPEQLEKIFLPFYQKDDSSTRAHGGAGLGLTIVKRQVEFLGGQVSAVSEVGKGSRFWFDLSFTEAPAPEASESEETLPDAESSVSIEGLKVLVVEDMELNRIVAAEMIHHLGAKAALAENGKQALERMERESFDLVLMDCLMPELDGFEATRAIRKREQEQGLGHTPIVALTAKAMVGDQDRCIEAGMDGFLAKPLYMKDLAAVLKRHAGEASEQG